jgi:hypothetical protein
MTDNDNSNSNSNNGTRYLSIGADDRLDIPLPLLLLREKKPKRPSR